jgi:hypothetical protein
MTFACEYCGKEFVKPVTSGHKRKCPEFLAANPDRKPPACLCGHEGTSFTQMKRHRKVCAVWGARDKDAVAIERIKSTLQKKYGVSNVVDVPGSAEKRAATNIERYGAKNPFSKESSLYEKVQSYWDGKDRTAHLDKNNWANPEVKEKIRQVNLERYGYENPSQVPEIRAKQLATSLKNHGDEQPLRVPAIREKGRQTNMERLGVPDPAQSPIVQEKIKNTNMERCGVPWTTSDPVTRSKMHQSQIDRYGSMFFSSEEGKKAVKETFFKRIESYHQTNLIRYGATHPMKNVDYARKHLEHSRRAGPNLLEQRFSELFPEFFFSGGGSFWKLIPSAKCNKNPDFCYPVHKKPDGSPSFRLVDRVVEILGDYWHGEKKTGEKVEIHAQNLVNQWAEVGLRCLIVWEHEFDNDLESLSARVCKFKRV